MTSTPTGTSPRTTSPRTTSPRADADDVAAIGSGSEASLVERIRRGEPDAFEELMRKYNRQLYRAARSIVREDAAAEDAVQHAYLAAFAKIDGFSGRARLSTWLTRIAINEALATKRRTARDVPQEQPEVGASVLRREIPSPEDEMSRHELRSLLEDSIDSLPETYRTVFMLRDVEGLSGDETAVCLGLTEQNVRVRLYRARGMLREMLYAKVGDNLTDVFDFAGERCDRIVAGVLMRLAERASVTP